MMVKTQKQLNKWLLCMMSILMLVFVLLPVEASAISPIDLDKTCSLTVKYIHENQAVSSVSFSLYRVGDINESGDLSFVSPYNNQFQIGEAMDRDGWDELASGVFAYCMNNQITFDVESETDFSGAAVFLDLTPGLYLIVGHDTEIDDMLYASLPFLVSLPNWNMRDGCWDYDVIAVPKMNVKPAPAPTPTPQPTSPPEETLIQTGQLWWPVPVMLFAALVLLVLGIVLGRKRFMVFFGFSLCCMALALSLFFYNMWHDARADYMAMKERNLLVKEIIPEVGANSLSDEDAASVLDKIADMQSDGLTEYKEMPVTTVEGVDYVGLLSLPALELELPIRAEVTYPGLQHSPCRYSGSAYMNDFVICAHNYSHHFGRIKDLKSGDEVLFVDADGVLFRYEVVLIETLGPRDVNKMKYSEYDLTLYTCTFGGQYRVTVRCNRVDNVLSREK